LISIVNSFYIFINYGQYGVPVSPLT